MDPARTVVAAPPAPVAGGGAAAAPAPVAGGGAAADNAARYMACFWWQPIVLRRTMTQAHVRMAAAAAALAVFASTLKPATFPPLQTQCMTTAADAIELRYYSALLLLCATAQGTAAAAALLIKPLSSLSGLLAWAANLLGIATLARLFQVAPRALSAAIGFCFLRGHAHSAAFLSQLQLHAILAAMFVCTFHLLWFIGQWRRPNKKVGQ